MVRAHEHERGAGSMMTGGSLRAFQAACAQRQKAMLQKGFVMGKLRYKKREELHRGGK